MLRKITLRDVHHLPGFQLEMTTLNPGKIQGIINIQHVSKRHLGKQYTVYSPHAVKHQGTGSHVVVAPSHIFSSQTGRCTRLKEWHEDATIP